MSQPLPGFKEWKYLSDKMPATAFTYVTSEHNAGGAGGFKPNELKPRLPFGVPMQTPQRSKYQAPDFFATRGTVFTTPGDMKKIEMSDLGQRADTPLPPPRIEKWQRIEMYQSPKPNKFF